eukprot:NODE_4757_length_629_cov_112.275862_g4093_i0.p1 GENE.NODE_4757_length_629_cov_112.275862_g4093_i0~~NODE_4757_length_629_cov_112.275862_g4093_i0.p1  ORF type:complete len:194 (+),score=6.55 NODE_4757_length_629_cov_112.275862_g4093_i0:22-582(+)
MGRLNMGNFFTGLFGKLFSKQEYRILMLGLNNAGKTSILFQLNLGEFLQVAPTTAFNVETVEHNNVKFQVWDLAGQKGIRPFWRSYYTDSQAVIFVIDSTDQDKMDTVKEEFLKLMEEDELSGIPVMVLANKQDLPDACNEAEISAKLGLDTIKTRQWAIFKTSAVTGKGLKESMTWLVDTMSQQQ